MHKAESHVENTSIHLDCTYPVVARACVISFVMKVNPVHHEYGIVSSRIRNECKGSCAEPEGWCGPPTRQFVKQNKRSLSCVR